MKRVQLASLILILSLLVACVKATPPPTPTPLPPTPVPVDENAITLTLADISDDPAEVADQMQPFADYLVARLGEFGITRSEVRVAATADEMSALLKSGEVDIYFDSLYPATLISETSGAKAILRRWRYGVGEYHTIIYTKKDGSIQSLDDLPGMMLAMDNPFSTSGYVLPAVYLLEKGFKLTAKQTYDEAVAADEIGFVFSYDDQNAMQWVVSGLVDAGVTDNARWASFPADVTGGLTILAETDAVPRQVVLVQPGLDEKLQAAIMQILLSMNETEEGKLALEAFDKTARFDEFPEGISAAQAEMRKMIEIVRQIALPAWVFEK